MSARSMSNRPCPDCKSDQLFIGLSCFACGHQITFKPVDYEYQGRVTQRSKLSKEDLRERKNAARRLRRAAGMVG